MQAIDRRVGFAWVGLLIIVGCASQPSPPAMSAATSPARDMGVVVMAHGGTPDWNAGVLETVESIRNRYPVEVAFGMADALSLQESVRKLEARGIRKIAVVRLFVSGESWLERTQQILGVRAGAPTQDDGAHTGHPEHNMAGPNMAGHSMAFFRIQTDVSFAVSHEGLADAEGMGNVLADRALALSQKPESEDVLILAHGPEDDVENQRWLAKLDQRAASIRARAPFRRVQVATLREDWPDKRAPAEKEIRAFVTRASAEAGKAIVIPFRVHGFGPYAEVLEGLEYASDGKGLIPHSEVAHWLEQQVSALAVSPFEPQAAR